jgi:hypothetical protein
MTANAKKLALIFWKEQIKPLIEKRNGILDAHNNLFESFKLPEVVALDEEIDRLEKEMLLMNSVAPEDILTHEAMMNPQVGDRFEEFFTYWMYVVKVTKKSVWTLSATAPCTFPEDGKLEKRTRKEFIDHYSYNFPNLPNKYWVKLRDRKNDVRGWVK